MMKFAFVRIGTKCFTYYLILLLSSVTEGSPLAPTRLLVTRVGPCYEFDLSKDVVTVSEMSLSRDLYDCSLSGYLNISKDIPNGWIVKATMQKCHDIRNLDTCDFFKQFRIIDNGCVDSEDEDLYNMFFHYVKPKLDCPIKAGNYKITDYHFFAEDSDLTAAESKISTSVFGYTYRLEGYDDDEARLLCIDASLQLLYIREHDWTDKKDFHLATTNVSWSLPVQPEDNSPNTNRNKGDNQNEETDDVYTGDEAQNNNDYVAGGDANKDGGE